MRETLQARVIRAMALAESKAVKAHNLITVTTVQKLLADAVRKARADLPRGKLCFVPEAQEALWGLPDPQVRGGKPAPWD